MDNLIEKLHADHRRLQDVLHRLEADLTACRQGRCDRQLLERLNNAVIYVHEYPRHWHHPAEEAIFEKILEKDIPEQRQIEMLLYEHRDMESDGQALIDEISALTVRDDAPTDSVLDRIVTMIVRQRDHQQRENEEVYPLVFRYLPGSEWQPLMRRIYNLPHNAALQQHYLSIYHHLLHQRAD